MKVFVFKIFFKKQKPPEIPEASLSYEGGDSELFNYLDTYLKIKMCTKCVQILI